MKVLHEPTLDLFRGPGSCEVCFSRVARREPHHIIAKGRDAANQLDIVINLVALCAPFTGGKDCHTIYHNQGQLKFRGRILRVPELLEIVHHREKIPMDVDLLEVLWCLCRMPKDARPWQFERETKGMTRDQVEIVTGVMVRAAVQEARRWG